jgi:endo-1,4-beta-xylanase
MLAFACSTNCVADDTLRSIAERKDMKIGVMALDATWNSPEQKALVASEFNVVTVGAYWNRTHRERDVYDWSVTDAVVNWADSEGLGVHLHPLLYPADTQTPAWVQTSPHSEAPTILEEHISTAMTRYRGVVDVWDVVNEAVSPSGGYRDCWWLQALGPNYIVEAFRLARQYDPDAVLVYNDHDIELTSSYQTAKWTQVQTILETLAAEDLVDGLGWQLHTNPGEVLGDQFALAERMQWVESKGLKNFVTELDMEIGPGDAALEEQRAAYQEVAEVWLEHNNGGWLQTWGVYDRYTWLGAETRPLLFDEEYNRKPAYYGVRDALLADTSADFNADGAIDGADFLAWQRDINSQGYEASDLRSWMNQFAMPNPNLLSTAADSQLPEPHSAGFLLSAGAGLALGRRTITARNPYSSRYPVAWASSSSHRR